MKMQLRKRAEKGYLFVHAKGFAREWGIIQSAGDIRVMSKVVYHGSLGR